MKRLLYTLLSLIGLVINAGIIIYSCIDKNNSIITVVAIAMAIISTVLMGHSLRREQYEKSCGKCNVKYDYEDNVSWEIIDEKIKSYRVNENTKPTDISEKLTYVLELNCTCPKCEKTKTFKKKIPGPTLKYNGDLARGKTPEQFLKKYYRKVPGIGAGIANLISGAFCGILLSIFTLLISLAIPYCANLITYVFPAAEDIVNEVIADENNADPKDYYGEYYIHTSGLILKANITENECLLTCDYLIQADETITCEYEYIPAEHVGENMFITPTGKDALIIYTSANKISDYIVLWVMDKNDGVYQFQTATGLDVSNTPITFEDLINDPKNYFGNYIHSNYYLTLNEDGTAIADIGNGTQNFKFAYCPSEVTCEVVDSGRAIEAIILYSESSDSIYVFEIKDTSTLILNEWEFVDEEAAGAMGLVDPKDYFGKYYYHNGSRIVCIDIQDTTCTVIHDNLITSDETINCTYRFIPAKYVSEELSEIAYPDCAAIFVYTDSVTKDGFTLWVTAKSDGNYTFTTSDGHIATTTPLTFADVTNDPQNYYGTFSYANLYVTLKEDGTAVADLGEGAVNYSFVYVDAALANKIFSKGSYGNSILLYIENTNSLYVFNVKNTNTLVLNDTYEFTK